MWSDFPARGNLHFCQRASHLLHLGQRNILLVNWPQTNTTSKCLKTETNKVQRICLGNGTKSNGSCQLQRIKWLCHGSMKDFVFKYLIILVWCFLEPFLQLPYFPLSSVHVWTRLHIGLCSRHLDPGMKLISAAFCFAVVVNARVGIVVQLTSLRKKNGVVCQIAAEMNSAIDTNSLQRSSWRTES